MEIKVVDWSDARSALTHIRQKVFVEEQAVPESLEWDAQDSNAVHFLGKEGNRPVACARLLKGDKLGRVAVLKEYRHHGWGSRLIKAAEQYLIEHKRNRLNLSAQARAYNFYFENGFRPEARYEWDADIPHIGLSKHLNRTAPTGSPFFLSKILIAIPANARTKRRMGISIFIIV